VNTKHVMVAGLILLIALSSISVISAAEKSVDTGYVFTNGKLTIDNLEFKIPEGYTQVETDKDATHVDEDGEIDVEDIDGTKVDAKTSCDCKNTAGDEIEVTVGKKANNEKIQSINPANSQPKNIAGKDGYLITDNDDGKTVYKFEYLEDGQLVKVRANSEDIISQIITK